MRVIISAFLSILCQTALTGANVIDKRSSFTLPPTVLSPSPEYVKLLNHSIMFFEAQRSGKLPDDNRISWRHDSALSDGSDVDYDLSGGYYDAGDYLKNILCIVYISSELYDLYAMLGSTKSNKGTDYIHGYQLANQTKYLRDQVKWATDWLIKAHPSPSTLFVQVGDVEIDNDSFGPDSDIKYPRPSYQINETDFGTDAAAMAATAFASASTFFSNLVDVTNENQDDRKYADTLLTHATQLYSAARNILPYSRYHKSVPTMRHVYSSSGYMDELLLAGVVLYRATKQQFYLDDTIEMYRETRGLNNHTEPLDWDNKWRQWGAFYSLLAEATLDYRDQNEALLVREEAEAYLDGIVSGKTANKTDGGLLFWEAYSKVNSNSLAMSTSFLLLSYSAKLLRPLAETSVEKDALLAKAQRYEDFANSQIDYIFGKNPINQHYVVGERSNSPKYPHSAPASGFTSLKEALKHPEDLSRAHTIYGGGPSRNDSFADVRLDWSQTEVALDYNAPYQNILAYQVMFHAEDPFYMMTDKTSSPYVDQLENKANLPAWGFALAIVLPTLVLLGVSVSAFILFRRRQNDRKAQEEAIYAIHSAKDRYRSQDGITAEEQIRPVANQLGVISGSSGQMPLNGTILVGDTGSTSVSNEKLDLTDHHEKNVAFPPVVSEKHQY
ncbi:glycoside hydrolase family 9 protein [Mucor ambiguus]|uniref:Endoglucanase n=1 Tax=Mucor ambiguus TaxID=91626 RepID=A0A0C9MG00_9FUNG|nr:glycoside hydrolase family 9 protein [Mucor ambiguus]